MTGEQTLIARVVVAGFVSTIGICLYNRKRFRRLSWPRFVTELTLAFVAGRLALYLLVFFLLHIAPRGDVSAVYFREAQFAAKGMLPYRDFSSSYAPLHAFMDAAVLSLRNDSRMLVLFAILGDSLLFWCWLRLSKRLFSSATTRAAALLYLTSAIGFQFVTIDGQDTVFVGLAFVCCLFPLLRRKYFVSGILFGISVCLLKFLPLVFVPIFLVALYGDGEPQPQTIPRALNAPLRWAAGLVAIIGLTFGATIYLRLPFLQPLKLEAFYRTAGNFPFFIESITGHMFGSAVWDPLTVIFLLAVVVLVARASWKAALDVRLRALIFGAAATTFALNGIAKKSWPAYLMLALYPICLLVAHPRWRRPANRLREIYWFTAFTMVALVTPSFWSSIVGQPASVWVFQRLRIGQTSAKFFVVLQVLLLIGYGFYLVRSLKLLADPRAVGAARDPSPMSR